MASMSISDSAKKGFTASPVVLLILRRLIVRGARVRMWRGRRNLRVRGGAG